MKNKTLLIAACFMVSFLFSGCSGGKMSRKDLTREIVLRKTAAVSDSISTVIQKIQNRNAGAVKADSITFRHARYHVIVVSFLERDKEEADKFVSGLRAGGITANAIVSKGRIRIAYSSYRTLEEAVAGRDSLVAEKPEYNDAWILRYTPQ